MSKRIKITDDLRNVSYIHFSNGRWCCALSNGMQASFFYAVGNCDEADLRFRLEDAETDEARLNIVKELAGRRRVVEFFA